MPSTHVSEGPPPAVVGRSSMIAPAVPFTCKSAEGLTVPMPTFPQVVVVKPPGPCTQQLFCKFVVQLVTVWVVPTDEVFKVTCTEAGLIARIILVELKLIWKNPVYAPVVPLLVPARFTT